MGWPWQRSTFALLLVSLLLHLDRSLAQYASLNCVQATDNSDLVQTCTGSDTLPLGAQVNFQSLLRPSGMKLLMMLENGQCQPLLKPH